MSFFIRSSRKPSWAISRRSVLRGGGALLALPMLDAMGTRAWASGHALKRVLFLYSPNGVIADKHAEETDTRSLHWYPATSESSLSLTHPLEPLEAYKSDMLMLRGLYNAPGEGPAHHASTGAYLTATQVPMDEVANDISADQVIAQGLARETPYRSLAVSTHGSNVAGNSSDGYPASYSQTISWQGPGQPVVAPKPDALFNQIFGASSAYLDDAERNRRKLSVLHFVNAEAQALRTKLGSDDRAKLDQYLGSIESVENRISEFPSLQCEPGALPADTGEYLHRLDLMTEVIALLFQCDATRVITAMTHAAGASHSVAYDWVSDRNGASLGERFHTYSHEEDADSHFIMNQINRWEMEIFANLLDKLDSISDGSGLSLLDTTLVHYGKELGDSDHHQTFDMPNILIDRSQTLGPTGRYLALASETPWANLLLAEINAMGVAATSFGDSTGVLDLS
jgi:hypothetical protein